jgi:hypothetical protein
MSRGYKGTCKVRFQLARANETHAEQDYLLNYNVIRFKLIDVSDGRAVFLVFRVE